MKSHGLLNGKKSEKGCIGKKKTFLNSSKALKDEQAKKKNRLPSNRNNGEHLVQL
jgi:hypothetical protein